MAAPPLRLRVRLVWAIPTRDSLIGPPSSASICSRVLPFLVWRWACTARGGQAQGVACHLRGSRRPGAVEGRAQLTILVLGVFLQRLGLLLLGKRRLDDRVSACVSRRCHGGGLRSSQMACWKCFGAAERRQEAEKRPVATLAAARSSAESSAEREFCSNSEVQQLFNNAKAVAAC